MFLDGIVCEMNEVVVNVVSWKGLPWCSYVGLLEKIYMELVS